MINRQALTAGELGNQGTGNRLAHLAQDAYNPDSQRRQTGDEFTCLQPLRVNPVPHPRTFGLATQVEFHIAAVLRRVLHQIQQMLRRLHDERHVHLSPCQDETAPRHFRWKPSYPDRKNVEWFRSALTTICLGRLLLYIPPCVHRAAFLFPLHSQGTHFTTSPITFQSRFYFAYMMHEFGANHRLFL